MSFEGELAPSFTLRCLEPGRDLPDGWGLGYYPKGEPSAAVLKEPAPPQTSIRSQLALAWEPVGSTDTEAIFCGLLNRFVERGWKNLAQVDLDTLVGWLHEINEGGGLSL